MLDKYFTNITKAEVSVNFFNFEKINRKEIKKKLDNNSTYFEDISKKDALEIFKKLLGSKATDANNSPVSVLEDYITVSLVFSIILYKLAFFPKFFLKSQSNISF